MRMSFKKLYFYSLLIGSLLLLGLQVSLNLLENESVLITSNIIITIAVLIGLIGSIIVRKKEDDNQK